MEKGVVQKRYALGEIGENLKAELKLSELVAGIMFVEVHFCPPLVRSRSPYGRVFQEIRAIPYMTVVAMLTAVIIGLGIFVDVRRNA